MLYINIIYITCFTILLDDITYLDCSSSYFVLIACFDDAKLIFGGPKTILLLSILL